jgi:tetratricopeptide (TPR) repeat protein
MMKKTVLTLVSILALSTAIAQKGNVTSAITFLDQGNAFKAKKAINEAINNEKTSEWPRTYIVAAKVFTELARKGKDDKGIIKAYEYYQKAIDLDKKGDAKGKKIGKYKKEISQALLLFRNQLTNTGVEAFNNEDYKTAFKAFEGQLKLNKNEYMIDILGEVYDTTIVYNAAIAAYSSKQYDAAEKYFDDLVDVKYGNGDIILFLHQVHSATGDSAKMGPNLKKGFEVYNGYERILTQLINYYLETKQNDMAYDYLSKAIKNDETNPSYYYARGVLNDNSKQFEGALADYKKCLEIDPEFFNALYNLGVMYFNKGVEQMQEANNERDFKKFEQKKKIAEATFKESLPYFEKCLTINDKEPAVLENLKTLYYRFEMNDKYKEVDAKLKAL